MAQVLGCGPQCLTTATLFATVMAKTRVHTFPSFLPCTFFLFSILIHFSTYFLSFSMFHLFTSLYLSCHTHPCTEIIPSLREHFLRVVLLYVCAPYIFTSSISLLLPLFLFTLVFPHSPDYLPPLLKWIPASRSQEGLGD